MGKNVAVQIGEAKITDPFSGRVITIYIYRDQETGGTFGIESNDMKDQESCVNPFGDTIDERHKHYIYFPD